MPTRSARKESRAAKKIADLAISAPVVIAQRMSRMAMPGVPSSAAGRRESSRMVSEKVAASTEAAIGATAAIIRANVHFAALLMRPWFLAGGSPNRSAAAFTNLMRSAAADVASSAVAPALRKVKANARRLSR